MEREEISAGNQGKVKRTGIVFFIYGAYGDWCIYPCACTALPVHAAAFIHDPFRAHFREQERSGLRGSLCSSRSVGGSRFTQGGGPGYIFQPTFGYLLGFIAGAWLTGKLSEHMEKLSFVRILFANLAGLLVVYLLEWFMYTS